MANLLLDERAVVVQPSLVRSLASMASAAVLQQLNYHLANGHTHEIDGETWAPVTYEQLSEEVGLTADQVRRAVDALEDRKVLLSCQPEGRASRRKSYRIDYDHELLRSGVSARRSGTGATSASGTGATSSSSQRSKTPRSASAPDGDVPQGTIPQAEENPGESRAEVLAERSRAGRALARSGNTGRGSGARRRATAEAGKVTDAWWEACEPRPLGQHTYVAVRQIVDDALRKHWTAEEVLAALKRCELPIVGWKLEQELRKVRGETAPRNNAARRFWEEGQRGEQPPSG